MPRGKGSFWLCARAAGPAKRDASRTAQQAGGNARHFRASKRRARGRQPMRTDKILLLAGASFTAVFLAGGIPAQAQNAATLSGKVSSPTEPAMEGVIVGARKDGGNITVSVVSDD